jgi:hypothetical protein
MEPVDETQRRSRGNGLCECLLMTLVLYSLVPAEASAGEQPQAADARRRVEAQKATRSQFAMPSFPAEFAIAVPRAETPAFSPTEFRPRRAALPEAANTRIETSIIDAPMLRDASIARELSEAKTQDRVRLLTLWQSRASSLSLQTGKHGAPTLQWSTPWMHRDAASRGLFDRLLAIPSHGFGSTTRAGGSRPGVEAAPTKPFDLSSPANNK